MALFDIVRAPNEVRVFCTLLLKLHRKGTPPLDQGDLGKADRQVMMHMRKGLPMRQVPLLIFLCHVHRCLFFYLLRGEGFFLALAEVAMTYTTHKT